jgi:hypothetical protein
MGHPVIAPFSNGRMKFKHLFETGIGRKEGDCVNFSRFQKKAKKTALEGHSRAGGKLGRWGSLFEGVVIAAFSEGLDPARKPGFRRLDCSSHDDLPAGRRCPNRHQTYRRQGCLEVIAITHGRFDDSSVCGATELGVHPARLPDTGHAHSHLRIERAPHLFHTTVRWRARGPFKFRNNVADRDRE